MRKKEALVERSSTTPLYAPLYAPLLCSALVLPLGLPSPPLLSYANGETPPSNPLQRREMERGRLEGGRTQGKKNGALEPPCRLSLR